MFKQYLKIIIMTEYMPSLNMYPITQGINDANFRKGGKKTKRNTKKRKTRRKLKLV